MARREVTDPELLAELKRDIALSYTSSDQPVSSKPKNTISAGEAFVHGGVDSIPFGKLVTALGTSGALKLIQAISDNPSYQDMDTSVAKQLNYENDKLSRSEKEHGYATGAGKIAGGAASALALPSLGISNPTVSAGVDAARYGALHGLGEGDLDTSLKDRLLRGSKEGVQSGVLGAASYPVGKYIGDKLPEAAKYISEGAKNLAGRSRVVGMHPTPTIARAMQELEGGKPGVGRTLLENKISGFSNESAIPKISSAQNMVGQQLDEIIKAADEAAVQTGVAPPYPPHAINRALRDVVGPMTEKAHVSSIAGAGRDAEKYLLQNREIYGAKNPTFSKMQQMKRDIGVEAYGKGSQHGVNQDPVAGHYGDALNKAYGITNEAIKERMGKVSPEALSKYIPANLNSERLRLAMEATQQAAARDTGKLPIGLYDVAAGMGLGAGYGPQAGLAAAIGTKVARQFGPQTVAQMLYKTGSGIEGASKLVSKLPISKAEKTSLLSSILRASTQEYLESKNE